MSLLWELTKLDLLATQDWFKKQTISKIFIIGLYLLVLLGVAAGIFLWSSVFFQNLLAYEVFGEQTALYVAKSGVIVLSWIGILSTFVSTVSFLLTSDKNTDLLITHPIPDILISLHSTIRSFLINLVLFFVSVFPLLLAYNLARPGFSQQVALGNSIGVLVLVLFVSQFVGSSLGYVVSFLLRQRYGLFIGLLFGLLLAFTTWFILRLVLPQELKQLSDISAENYSTFFNNLPLMKGFWVLQLSPLAVTLLVTLMTTISIAIQKVLFLPCWQTAKVHFSTLKKADVFNFRSINLATKDLLSILRSSSDIAYLLFLLSMILAFFGLFSRGYLVNSISDRFRVDALVFSFAWLVFFSGTYLIRLSYPLMVNEGKSRWWYFTQPVIPFRQLASKVAASLILALPLIVVAIFEWQLIPFALSVSLLVSLSLISIVLLAILFPLFGSIYPEYRLAYNPDMASTSFTGLISIVFVFAVGLFGGWLISETLRGGLEPGSAISGYLLFSALTAVSTSALALVLTRRYTVDI